MHTCMHTYVHAYMQAYGQAYSTQSQAARQGSRPTHGYMDNQAVRQSGGQTGGHHLQSVRLIEGYVNVLA